MTAVVSYNPRTGEPAGAPIPVTEPDVVDAVVRSATGANAAWSALTGVARAAVLDAVAAALDADVDELIALADAETALGELRLRGEVARTTGQLRMFAGLLREGSYVEAIITPADPSAARPDVRRMLAPIGPVAVFSASNFPFAFSVAGGDTASALAAGCPVIVKAHEGHPHTSARTFEIVARALRSAGAPDGVFRIVYGVEAGRRLVLHRAVRAVGFTGSTTGGRALFDLTSRRPDPIPFYGELGSVNHVVVLPSAARTRAQALAQGYADSLTLGVGQFCTNPGLLFAPADEILLGAIRAAVAVTTGGPMLTQRMHDSYVAATGDPDWASRELLAHGTADGPWAAVPEVRTAPIDEFARDTEQLTQERFGPAGLVVTYDHIEQALPVLATLPGSLTAAIHATDDELDTARAVADTLLPSVGRLIMNGWPTGVAVCWAMHHGGPWPATTSAAHTSVGATAIRRWLAPTAYQDWPGALLPPALQADNPLRIARITQD
ncbi:MAG: aldehyde dehydrogenase (NADP(+)) [Mycobacteriales bacterium]